MKLRKQCLGTKRKENPVVKLLQKRKKLSIRPCNDNLAKKIYRYLFREFIKYLKLLTVKSNASCNTYISISVFKRSSILMFQLLCSNYLFMTTLCSIIAKTIN